MDFDLRECKKKHGGCGFITYLRKGACINRGCRRFYVFLQDWNYNGAGRDCPRATLLPPPRQHSLPPPPPPPPRSSSPTRSNRSTVTVKAMPRTRVPLVLRSRPASPEPHSPAETETESPVSIEAPTESEVAASAPVVIPAVPIAIPAVRTWTEVCVIIKFSRYA